MTDDHDRGLQFDLSTLNRRRLLGVAGVAGLATLAGCSTGGTDSQGSGSAGVSGAAGASGTAGAAGGNDAGSGSGSGSGSTGDLTKIPQETGGPYPGDGSNGPNALKQTGIVRRDIRSSFGSATGVAQGIPLTVKLTVLDLSRSGAAYSGAAIYLWHCDRHGEYSMYGQSVSNENYLRGVQEADTNGTLTFQTIFPAAYSGRWPHIHFEVYPSVSSATASSNKITTSQLALPKDICHTVYATTGYEASVRNLASTSLDRDMVFSDGYGHQMAAVIGDLNSGYTATLTVPV